MNQVTAKTKAKRGFTLLELTVVIAILAILVGLLLPMLGRSKESARRSACISNLKQVNTAIHLYANDWSDFLPVLPHPNPYPNGVGAYYKQLVKGYLGLTGPALPTETVFICPADTTQKTQVQQAFNSYPFNGFETGPGSLRRITGQKLGSIRHPDTTVLLGEFPAFFGGSWHPPTPTKSTNAMGILSFIDGHASLTRIYWDEDPRSHPADYNPPKGYDYNWNGL